MYWSDKTGIALLSVLSDPERLEKIIDDGNAGLRGDVAYIFRKQLEESNIIVITKTDLLSDALLNDLASKTKQDYPYSTIMIMSAVSGDGVDAW